MSQVRPSRADKIRRASHVQITSKTFVASMLIFRGEVVEVAPILRKWVHKREPASYALDVLRKMGFGVKVIRPEDDFATEGQGGS